jgi:enolase-phosphatase E1
MIQAVLCDIEGTTTSLSFAHDVMFPYSRKEMPAFIRERWNHPDLKPLFTQLGKDTPEETTRLLQSWIDEDKKEGVLKQIQGKIWRKAFESGEIRAHIYPDVPTKWFAWKESGKKIYIFSSGSVEAQQLIFRFSELGDLSQLIDGYFDTTTGPKKEADSYRKIADAIQIQPNDVLFLSDVVAELDAAGAAGMQTILVVRNGQSVASNHRSVSTFKEIKIQRAGLKPRPQNAD